VMIYAHRGSSSTHRENSIAAFQQAMTDGADGVELDVRATSDGHLVVLHDRDVSRTTTGLGFVDQMTLATLQRFTTDEGESIPTLDEVIGLLAGHLHIDLEIKQAGTEREVLALLANHPAADWAISSFDWDILHVIRGIDAAAELWPLALVATDDLFVTARNLAAPAVALSAAAINADVLARCVEEKVSVVAWTVNDLDEAANLQRLGTAAICTDRPATMVQTLKREVSSRNGTDHLGTL